MSQELDETLGNLLRESSIPPRDPMFRIRVLERRERRRYRQRQRTLLVLMAAAVVLPSVFLAVPPSLSATRLLGVGLVVVFGVAVVAAGLLSARGVLQAIRWLRSSTHP